MNKLQKSIIQIAAMIAATVGIAASISLAKNTTKDSVYVCVNERKWFPLYPRVIHSKGCSNDWKGSAIGILAGSAGIAFIVFSVYNKTTKYNGSSTNMLNIKTGNPKHKALAEAKTISLKGNNNTKIVAATARTEIPNMPTTAKTIKATQLRILGGVIALLATGVILTPFLIYQALDRIHANSAYADTTARTDGYWLDQYNATLYLLALSLDDEFREMRTQGAKVVLIHADSLPAIVLEQIAREANKEGLKVIAWIQKPNKENLLRTGKLNNYEGVQVDDHFFASPPITLTDLRRQIGKKQLWCSFQPKQYSSYAAQQCDHIDVQVYRNSCLSTLYAAENFGLTNRSNAAIAVYDDGSIEGRRETSCILRGLASMNGRSLVFKWNNQEVWTKPIWQLIGKVVRLRA